MKKQTIIYGGKRPKGYVLAHNDVLHAKNTVHGQRGFRRFWLAPDQEGWSVCLCGWRGKHYSKVPEIPAYECESVFEEIEYKAMKRKAA